MGAILRLSACHTAQGGQATFERGEESKVMARFKVGILGATGTVGQRFVQLLADHPWFEISEVAASDKSAGKRYEEAVNWKLDSPIPACVRDLRVKELRPDLDCDFVFSSLDSAVADCEETFARAGYPVISNTRIHRMDEDVPLLIADVNPKHIEILPFQKKRRGFHTGFLVANPNCSATGLALALKPLEDAFGLEKVMVVTMQAISGAGYPGIPSADILDNVVPFIVDEEEKLESEPRKILGRLEKNTFLPATISVSAQCNRVPVLDGHLESVYVKLRQKASPADVADLLRSWVAEPEARRLPSSPEHPVVVREEKDRPQSRLDRNLENGMAAVVGRIRPCPLFDLRFTVLSHNTIRGAAGTAILNAELLADKGHLSSRLSMKSDLRLADG